MQNPAGHPLDFLTEYQVKNCILYGLWGMVYFLRIVKRETNTVYAGSLGAFSAFWLICEFSGAERQKKNPGLSVEVLKLHHGHPVRWSANAPGISPALT